MQFPSNHIRSFLTIAIAATTIAFSSGQGTEELSVIAGGFGNSVLGNYCTVSGGVRNKADFNDFATVSGGFSNLAEAAQSTVTGGSRNTINKECTSGTIVGGESNTIQGETSTECTIGAGIDNTIDNSPSATIVGGEENLIMNSNAGTIGGGQSNTVTGDFAVVGGGENNTASGQGSVIPSGQGNTARGDFSIAFGRRAFATDDRSLVMNYQESDDKLQSNGTSTFSAAATRFIFQIGKVQAVIDSTSIEELDGVLNPSGRRTLRSTTHSMMTPTRIRELIQEQKMKHEEQQDTVSKLQQELASLVEGEKHHQVRGLEFEIELQDLQEVDSVRLLQTGEDATEEQGKDNEASGAFSVVNGGKKNRATGGASVVGGGRKNSAMNPSTPPPIVGGVVGGGEKNKAVAEAAVVAGGKANVAKGGHTFIGGGEKNKCVGKMSSIGGGKKNKIKEAACFSFIGGGSKNQIEGEYGFIGGGTQNKIEGKYASILGGSKNLASGDYSTAMGWNALANEKFSMAIGLQVDATKFVRGKQVGDWILCAELIEFRIGDKSVALTEQNIKKFKDILSGTRRRRMEATSKEERTLLTELEDYEELVDYQEIEMEELEGDIQDFHRDRDLPQEEANEIEIDSD